MPCTDPGERVSRHETGSLSDPCKLTISGKEEDFISEPDEVQQAPKTVRWILDRRFDDIAVCRTAWEQKEHPVCRIDYTERLVEYRDIGWE